MSDNSGPGDAPAVCGRCTSAAVESGCSGRFADAVCPTFALRSAVRAGFIVFAGFTIAPGCAASSGFAFFPASAVLPNFTVSSGFAAYARFAAALGNTTFCGVPVSSGFAVFSGYTGSACSTASVVLRTYTASTTPFRDSSAASEVSLQTVGPETTDGTTDTAPAVKAAGSDTAGTEATDSEASAFDANDGAFVPDATATDATGKTPKPETPGGTIGRDTTGGEVGGTASVCTAAADGRTAFVGTRRSAGRPTSARSAAADRTVRIGPGARRPSDTGAA